MIILPKHRIPKPVKTTSNLESHTQGNGKLTSSTQRSSKPEDMNSDPNYVKVIPKDI